MKNAATIFIALLVFASVNAQTGFRTVVPQEAIVSGESFQVQYVLENGDKQLNIKPPIFSNFRFVTGPYVYMGSVATVNGARPVKNTVYTLEAGRPGKFVISGATIVINGKSIRSNDAFVEVISKDEALKRFDKQNSTAGSDYFLRPGENVYEKIKQNLFVKVMVDKKSCYVGEPVLATFKLYSRLESKSDIVKNPGFYGFTIFDMVNLADKQVATENIDGKIFDVHTIRKVQLYPLQSGSFTIDEMEVKNKVEFSRSAVLKKTEQEITEGVLGGNDSETPEEGKEVFETDIHTEPVVITVKPIPEKNKPETFNGATGRFSIDAVLTNKELAKNEQGFLEITIKGKGNFIQLSAPTIQWPAGIESFDPTVKDDLDKTVNPLAGSRTFRYPFVCSAGGAYQLPPVTISYFDIDSNTYKTISTDKINLAVSNEEKQNDLVVEEKKVSITEKNERASLIAVAIVIVLFLSVLIYWLKAKKEPEPQVLKAEPAFITPEEILQPAYVLVGKTLEEFETLQELREKPDKEFYSVVHTSIWNYLDIRFGFHSSDMNKTMLAARLQDKGINKELTDKLNQTLSHCETGMYTNASFDEDKKNFVDETKTLLEEIDKNQKTI